MLTSAGAIVQNGLSLSISGYSSAFEGPKAKFYGIDWNGNHYTSTQSNGGSSTQFDTVLHFDPDGSATGKPNIHGEMTTIFIPKESLSQIPSWAPTSWLQNNGYINNPQKTYEWNINGYSYKMEQYLMRWYCTFSAEWTENPVVTHSDASSTGEAFGEAPKAVLTSGGDNSFTDLGVWLEFEVTPTWYIEGGGRAYFSIAKMQLGENAVYQGKTLDGRTEDPRGTVSVSPESKASPIYMYYGPWGEGSAETQAYQYEGRQLNPDYFRDKVYAHIDMNQFGVYSGLNWFQQWTKGDTVTFCFDVTVFVIGEYKVQDIQDDPKQYGRFQKVNEPYEDLWTWFTSPATLGVLAIILLLIVVGAVLIFAPHLFFGIFTAFNSARKSGKSRSRGKR